MDKETRLSMLKELMETKPDKDRFLKVSFGTFYTFGEIHKKIEEIMERSVLTHEFAFPQMLYEEINNGNKGEAFVKSMNELSKTKKVIIIET